MNGEKQYKCVNCGEPTAALYRTYGPSVLKLNKCGLQSESEEMLSDFTNNILNFIVTSHQESCKGTVDKYIEYDPVIVMIDLVLMSKEAQRHVIYNTEFKSYWKLFIIMVFLETYGVWRNDSLFTMVVNSLCGIQTNSTVQSIHLALPFDVSMPEQWRPLCRGWEPDQRHDDSDLYVWEKDFCIQLISTLAGIAVFILTVHGMMKVLPSQSKASFPRLLKAFSLADAHVLLTLPALVWSAPETAAQTRALHYALVAAYSHAVFGSVFTVLYESPWLSTLVVLVSSTCAKYLTTFHVTPYLRGFVT